MMADCEQSVKLIKIYESDAFVNLMLDYQNGGTLKKLIKKKGNIPEEKARTIIM